MWIKALLENMDRIIHGGKHYPVVNGIANVPKSVRDDLIEQTHFEDVAHAIDPETIKAVQAANKAADVLEDVPNVIAPEEVEKEAEKLPEAAEVPEAPKEEVKAPKLKKTINKTK